MKIAIVTVYESFINSGSFLQAYAMQKKLNDLGHEVFFIRRFPDSQILHFYNSSGWKKRNYKKSDSYQKKIKNLLGYLRTCYRNEKRFNTAKKDWDNFNCINKEKLEEYKINCILCGSDEIWNIENLDLDINFYTCGWNKNISKIGYAISVGNSSFEDFTQKINNDICEFNTLLPRDINTQEILFQLTGSTKSTVCDPTILIEKSCFETKTLVKFSEPYFLVYSYSFSDIQKTYIKRYAKEHSLKIISFSLDASIADEIIYASSLEFPDYIKHAKCMFTSTFHGTIFALMFADYFCCCPRLPKIQEIIHKYDDQNHIFTDSFSYEKFVEIIENRIDHDLVDKKMLNDRNYSEAMLIDALKGINNGK